jgi:hypothetical protein
MTTEEKAKARKAAQRAVALGTLVREPCEVCSTEEVDAHHEDYSKPLEVRWLCRAHHHDVHRGERAGQGRPVRDLPEGAQELAAAMLEAEAAYQAASRRAETLRLERNRLVLEALAAGWTHAKISQVTGLSRGRISQIKP